jgi:hypothetical protein
VTGDADVYYRQGRIVRVPEFECFRYLQTFDTMLSLTWTLVWKSTLHICSYFKGNTLHLRYEPNRLMLSIGLRLWYINISHNSGHYQSSWLLFKTQLNIGKTLRLRYKPNMLMLSIGLRRWYINISHNSRYYSSSCLLLKTRSFREWILFLLLGDKDQQHLLDPPEDADKSSPRNIVL